MEEIQVKNIVVDLNEGMSPEEIHERKLISLLLSKYNGNRELLELQLRTSIKNQGLIDNLMSTISQH